MAFDMYMVVAGAPGDAPVSSLVDINGTAVTGAFEIYSFSFGVSDSVSLGGPTPSAGKPSLTSFNIMKKTDQASVPLFQAALTGRALSTAQVLLCGPIAAGSAPTFWQLDMTNVLVSSIQWSGSSGGDDTPTESVSFTAVTFRMSYQPTGAPGTAHPPVQSVQFDLSTQQVT